MIQRRYGDQIADLEIRCFSCNKFLAEMAGRPWRIRCGRCKATNISAKVQAPVIKRPPPAAPDVAPPAPKPGFRAEWDRMVKDQQKAGPSAVQTPVVDTPKENQDNRLHPVAKVPPRQDGHQWLNSISVSL